MINYQPQGSSIFIYTQYLYIILCSVPLPVQIPKWYSLIWCTILSHQMDLPQPNHGEAPFSLGEYEWPWRWRSNVGGNSPNKFNGSSKGTSREVRLTSMNTWYNTNLSSGQAYQGNPDNPNVPQLREWRNLVEVHKVLLGNSELSPQQSPVWEFKDI